jgi:hypothetical protein
VEGPAGIGKSELLAAVRANAQAHGFEWGERAALLLMLGTAEWRAGQPDAIAHLEQALAAAGDDLGTLIGASTVLALAYNVTDRAEGAVEVLEQALAAVGDTNAALALTAEAGIVLVGLMNERTAPAALRRAEGLRGRLRTMANPPVHVLVMLTSYAARMNRAAEARELAERAVACEPYPPPLEICNVLPGSRASPAAQATPQAATSARSAAAPAISQAAQAAPLAAVGRTRRVGRAAGLAVATITIRRAGPARSAVARTTPCPGAYSLGSILGGFGNGVSSNCGTFPATGQSC